MVPGSVLSQIANDWGPNAGYVEELYRLFVTDPSLVGESWAVYFSKFVAATTTQIVPLQQRALAAPEISRRGSELKSEFIEQVAKLVHAYRDRGHLIARISPLQSVKPQRVVATDLVLDSYPFSNGDFSKVVPAFGLAGNAEMPLSALIDELQRIYCGSIGFETAHLCSEEERLWLQERIENRFATAPLFQKEQRHRILEKLIIAENFEAQLHRKYVGQKRFSLQGGETIIPLLDNVIQVSGAHNVRELVIGMAHRGRLNVLANTLGKPLKDIFSEFEDQSVFTSLGSGDVKYHLGYENRVQDENGAEVRLALAPNPSHLEFVNPVVEGMVRARQDALYSGDRSAVLPVLIHGDSAVIGQGIVAETYNLYRVPGYETGGTLHIVINNQVGFTTSPEDYRSSTYCTDIAKGFDAPIFHINAEDPEAACWAARVALDFRSRFKRDVVIDLYCYRKYGHNEADDPSFTQPIMYAEIEKKDLLSKVFAEKLIAEGAITQSEIEAFTKRYDEKFEAAYSNRAPLAPAEGCALHGKLKIPAPDTGVVFDKLQQIASKLVRYPETFTPHPKLAQILKKRVEIFEKREKVDWAFAEALAFGSLVLDGVGVRLSGQDCGRGTFSQRHLVLTDYNSGELFLPLGQLTEEAPNGVRYEVYNSTLSEAAVLGFEYGFSAFARDRLVLWEGQFGDFANGAQVIIDQFIASSEAKWGERSGVVMLLPHGYEGQGPEHSSARLERYLQLYAEGNICVCYPTTASQYFHLLRRQGVMQLKRPLIVMTPKSLLRNPEAATAIDELTFGKFHTILEDGELNPDKVERIVFVAGKVCYDIRKGLKDAGLSNTSIIRIAQLAPFPDDELTAVLEKYSAAEKFIWVQEEPKNMGAWSFVSERFREDLKIELQYVGRPAAASTATGSGKRHAAEQKEIIETTVNLCK